MNRSMSLPKLILSIVLVVVLVLVVGRVTGLLKTPEEKRIAEAIAADPAFSEYTANSGQVSLQGFFVDDSKSTDESVYCYIVLEVKAIAPHSGAQGSTQGGTISFTETTSPSLVRVISLNDKHDSEDILGIESATAFAEQGIYSARYMTNTGLQGETLEPGTASESKLIVVACSYDRTLFKNGDNITIWFDSVPGFTNDGTGSHWPAHGNKAESTYGEFSADSPIVYDNIVFSFPSYLATNVSQESDVIARFK